MTEENNTQSQFCHHCPGTNTCTDQYKEEVKKDEFCEMKKYWSKYLDMCEA